MTASPSVTATTRIVFMGTPDFAASSLRALHEASTNNDGAVGETCHWEVVAVVTQPDPPSGRGKKVIASPVKEYAVAHDLPVLQPNSLRKEPETVAHLRELAPDLMVVAAYGLILPKSVLEIPTFGCINVHASLLPAYRGASPITAAILDGLDETGVSIMLMDEGMDTGPVLQQTRLPIQPDDTTATLSERLAQLGAESLVETLPLWLAGEMAPIPQEELPGEASICRLIKKAAGKIDWRDSANKIERMTRAYAPWPSAYTTWRGQPFKIWQAEVVPGHDGSAKMAGKIVETPGGPAVVTGEGLLLLQQVQPAGKRAMEVASFLNGAPDFVGSRLGE